MVDGVMHGKVYYHYIVRDERVAQHALPLEEFEATFKPDLENMTTIYSFQYQGETEFKKAFVNVPKNGMERHKIACNFLRDNPRVSQVRWETPSQHRRGAGSHIQHRSEDYTPDPKGKGPK